MSPEIKLDMISICTDTAAIGWMVFPAAGDTMEPLSNCSLFGYPETYRFHYLPKIHQLKASGVYKFQQKLLVGEQYSFQIRCGEIVSNSVSFIALGKYSKTCVTWPLKNRKNPNILMTNGSLMKAESIAECSPWNILQNF